MWSWWGCSWVLLTKIESGIGGIQHWNICCGEYHSYFRTSCDKHFICGGNDEAECVIAPESALYYPQRIDLILKQDNNAEHILKTGRYNSIFLKPPDLCKWVLVQQKFWNLFWSIIAPSLCVLCLNDRFETGPWLLTLQIPKSPRQKADIALVLTNQSFENP